MNMKKLWFRVGITILVLALISLPNFSVSVPNDHDSDGGALVVLLVKNHTRIPVGNVHFTFKKITSLVAMTLSSVRPKTSTIAFPSMASGEFAVEAKSDLFATACTDYWPGWPDGFQLDIYGGDGALHAKCTNKQWVDRYSAVDILLGWTPQLERDVHAIVP